MGSQRPNWIVNLAEVLHSEALQSDHAANEFGIHVHGCSDF